jgi:hypothetical protein
LALYREEDATRPARAVARRTPRALHNFKTPKAEGRPIRGGARLCAATASGDALASLSSPEAIFLRRLALRRRIIPPSDGERFRTPSQRVLLREASWLRSGGVFLSSLRCCPNCEPSSS